MARREWVSWGGELLFTELKEEIDREKKQEEEEARRRLAAEAKTERLEARRAALSDARATLLADFRAKKLSKEEVQKRNGELAAEAKAIERDEAGVEDDEKVDDEPELG